MFKVIMMILFTKVCVKLIVTIDRMASHYSAFIT